ncbi:metallophosphoesterase family protein [Aquirhabdus sp.]|uniref:metallophosphoesterase family protein n=1 Tax=Aquirhabdus sp. TaxID=2824160 RepID=UPI00396CB75E
MRIAIITDTHLAPHADAFNQNWLKVQTWIQQAAVDQVIHLGDITAAGSDDSQHLAFAHAKLNELSLPLHVLPGNHDVGDNPNQYSHHEEQWINADRLTHYRAIFGPDYWAITAGHWRLFGLNAQLFGRGGEAEQQQFEWLEQALSLLNDRASDDPNPIGVMLHKPLFRQDPSVEDSSGRYLLLEARTKLLQLLTGFDVRFVLSGHTHQSRSIHIDGVQHVWAPSTSFCIPDAVQEPIGQKIVAVMTLTLADDQHYFETHEVAGLVRHNLLDQMEVYPELIGMKAKLGKAGEL